MVGLSAALLVMNATNGNFKTRDCRNVIKEGARRLDFGSYDIHISIKCLSICHTFALVFKAVQFEGQCFKFSILMATKASIFFFPLNLN